MINGIYAATLSVLDKNLALNSEKTIKYAENLIDKGCHGVVFFGSTGQSQLISLSEKIQLINLLPKSNYRDKFIIGTGLNSLVDNINLIKIAKSNGFNKFLIMPPAYYKYSDHDVINFYSRIIDEINECKIILYNFEKLSGYKFSIDCVEELVKKFPSQIVGVKDSSYNLYENLSKLLFPRKKSGSFSFPKHIFISILSLSPLEKFLFPIHLSVKAFFSFFDFIFASIYL